MPELRCPMCGKDNPESEVNCVHCGARLVPLGETPPAPDAGPVSEEKDILSMLLEEDDGAPVDESQEFMEWLDKELSSEESGDEADLADETSEEASTEELLAALVSEPEDEKQISEWLHSMDQTVIVPDREPADEEDESDDAADLFAFPADELQEDEEDEESLSEEELLAQRTAIPDWFKDLLAEEPAEGPEAPEVLAESVDAVTPEWEALEDEAVDETTADFTESEPEEFVPAEEIPPLPGWFNQVLEEETPESAAPEFAAEKPEEIGEEPDWMKQPELAEDETGLEDILPEHLAESMDGQTIIEGVTAETRAVPAAELPGWFSDVEDTLGGEAVESAPESPEQLAAAEEETEAKPEKKGLFASLFGRGKRRKKSEAVPSDAPEEVPEELPRIEEAEMEFEPVLPEAEEEPAAVEQPGSDEIDSLLAEEPEFVFADETSEGDGLEALLAEELEPEMETGEPSFDQAAVEEAAAEELLTTSAEDTAEPVSELEALLAEEEFESEWAEETAEPREVVEAGVEPELPVLEPEEQAEEDFDAVVSEDFARLFEETGQLSAEDLDMFAGEETEAFSDEDMLFISEEAESAAEAEEEFADADAFMPEWLQVVMDETVSGTDISSPRLKAEEPAGAEEPETTAEAEEQPEPVPPEASAVEEPLEEDIYYGVDSTLFEKIDEGIRAASERADLAKEAEAETAGEDVPDWLEVPEEDTRGLFSERDDQFIGMTSEMAAVSPWISEEDEEEPEETGEFSAAEAELPGWLGEESEIEIQVSEEVGKIEEDFLPVEDESVDDVELPSWMDEPEEESADSYASAIEKVSGGTAELPAWMLDEEEAEEESFEDFGFSETFEETEAVEETAASPFMMDSAEMRELASALDSVEEPAYGTGGLEERGEFDGSYDEGRIADQADDRVEFGAMSDWLTGFGMEGVPAEETPVSERSAEEHSEVGETVSLDSVRDSLAIEAEAAQAPQDELLEPLPEWLDGDQQRLEFGSQGSIEESGPLEGLRGLLPGAAGLFDYSHARVSAGARVGTQDPEKVQLLRDVLDSEHHGKRIRVAKERNDFTGARLVFGILLVLILAVSMWLLPSPSARGLITNPPTQVVQFYQLMFNRMSIMPNQPVLVAFDFQPAYYAEMKAESEQVLKLLMQMHVPIARVSTVAESTLTSDLLMRHVVETYQLDYSIQNRSVNLGYLAGGNTAIRNFAMAPRENTHGLDVGTAGLYVWDRDLLAGIQSLNDFSMIIIMTDDLDTARLWLEQVQPTLSDEIPLFMISSAQISPMLKPYLTSGQIDGMLGSVLDAAAYATLTEETNWAVLNWNAYRFAIYLMIFALLGGIIYQVVIRTMIKPGKKARRAKAGSK